MVKKPEDTIFDDEEIEAAAEPQGSEAAAETDEEAVMAEAEAVITAAEELEAAKAEIAELKEKYLRLHAECDTYRRRMN